MTADPHGAGRVLLAGTPLQEASLAVVLLHGRGASADDILGLGAAFNIEGVAYLAPQASGGTWYPQSFLAPKEANQPFLGSALRKVATVVASLEQAGLERQRIVIAGFSQGACLATEFVASNPARYGGLLALTGGLIGPPGSLNLESNDASPFAGMPAFFGSGDPDPHVPWSRVQESAERLEALGATVTTRRYPGRPHTITQDEISHARVLLTAALQRAT